MCSDEAKTIEEREMKSRYSFNFAHISEYKYKIVAKSISETGFMLINALQFVIYY